MHEVLPGNDAHQALVLHHRNQIQLSRVETPEGGGEGFALVCGFENADHHGLDVTVAFGAERLHNGLAGDGPD